MRVRSILMLAVVALLAASCSSTEVEPTTSSTTSSTSTTTTTQVTTTTTTVAPSSTTTSTVVPVTLAPSDPFVTTGGMGPIRVGMGVEEAATAAGFELSGEPDPEVSERCYFVTPPDDEPDYAGVTFMVLDDVIVRVDVTGDSTVTTRSGAGIGVDEASLQAMFPGQLEETEVTAGGGTGLQFVPRDEEDAAYRVIFELADGVVSAYRAGILPAVAFLEGCN